MSTTSSTDPSISIRHRCATDFSVDSGFCNMRAMALLAEKVGGSDAAVGLNALKNPRLPPADASSSSSSASASASSFKSLAFGRAKPIPHITNSGNYTKRAEQRQKYVPYPRPSCSYLICLPRGLYRILHMPPVRAIVLFFSWSLRSYTYSDLAETG